MEYLRCIALIVGIKLYRHPPGGLNSSLTTSWSNCPGIQECPSSTPAGRRMAGLCAKASAWSYLTAGSTVQLGCNNLVGSTFDFEEQPAASISLPVHWGISKSLCLHGVIPEDCKGHRAMLPPRVLFNDSEDTSPTKIATPGEAG